MVLLEHSGRDWAEWRHPAVEQRGVQQAAQLSPELCW